MQDNTTTHPSLLGSASRCYSGKNELFSGKMNCFVGECAALTICKWLDVQVFSDKDNKT